MFSPLQKISPEILMFLVIFMKIESSIFTQKFEIFYEICWSKTNKIFLMKVWKGPLLCSCFIPLCYSKSAEFYQTCASLKYSKNQEMRRKKVMYPFVRGLELCTLRHLQHQHPPPCHPVPLPAQAVHQLRRFKQVFIPTVRSSTSQKYIKNLIWAVLPKLSFFT